MTPEELAAIRERTEKATPGPWETNFQKFGSDFGEYTVYGIKDVSPADWAPDSSEAFAYCEGMDQPDAEFIAAARTDIPALLDHIEWQNRQFARAKEGLDSHANKLWAIRKLHVVDTSPGFPEETPKCAECQHHYPCSTIQAIEG